jgi:hypothetical protein
VLESGDGARDSRRSTTPPAWPARIRPFQEVTRRCAGRSTTVFAVKLNYWLSL